MKFIGKQNTIKPPALYCGLREEFEALLKTRKEQIQMILQNVRKKLVKHGIQYRRSLEHTTDVQRVYRVENLQAYVR